MSLHAISVVFDDDGQLVTSKAAIKRMIAAPQRADDEVDSGPLTGSSPWMNAGLDAIDTAMGGGTSSPVKPQKQEKHKTPAKLPKAPAAPAPHESSITEKAGHVASDILKGVATVASPVMKVLGPLLAFL
jgi:hypothetical protein